MKNSTLLFLIALGSMTILTHAADNRPSTATARPAPSNSNATNDFSSYPQSVASILLAQQLMDDLTSSTAGATSTPLSFYESSAITSNQGSRKTPVVPGFGESTPAPTAPPAPFPTTAPAPTSTRSPQSEQPASIFSTLQSMNSQTTSPTPAGARSWFLDSMDIAQDGELVSDNPFTFQPAPLEENNNQAVSPTQAPIFQRRMARGHRAARRPASPSMTAGETPQTSNAIPQQASMNTSARPQTSPSMPAGAMPQNQSVLTLPPQLRQAQMETLPSMTIETFANFFGKLSQLDPSVINMNQEIRNIYKPYWLSLLRANSASEEDQKKQMENEQLFNTEEYATFTYANVQQHMIACAKKGHNPAAINPFGQFTPAARAIAHQDQMNQNAPAAAPAQQLVATAPTMALVVPGKIRDLHASFIHQLNNINMAQPMRDEIRHAYETGAMSDTQLRAIINSLRDERGTVLHPR